METRFLVLTGIFQNVIKQMVVGGVGNRRIHGCTALVFQRSVVAVCHGGQ